MQHLLDSSAVLAWLQQEPGGERVGTLLEEGIVTAANWSEILQKARQCGADPQEVGLMLRSLGLEVTEITRDDGERAAAIWQKGTPLSLDDRLCLAVAVRLGVPVLTTDALWENASVEGAQVEVLRR
ncbi:MAG TPA: PIN domain-containing protein [Actinomycetota bacterium]|nr:PIN domain-containing protein [Actinomycetota bacterium]